MSNRRSPPARSPHEAKPAPEAHVPVTRRDQKRRTRAALRDAALICFAKKGFLTTSILDITTEAGVAKGTFYVHYEDKEALLDELLVDFNTRLAERLSRVVLDAADKPIESVIRTIAGIFLDHWTSSAAFVRAYAERSSAGLDVAALPFGINPPVRDLLVTALRARAGGRLGAEPELVVHGLLAMWMRLGLQTIFRGDVDPARVIDTLVALTTGAIERVLGMPGGRAIGAEAGSAERSSAVTNRAGSDA